ncbi:MAG: alpha-amylase family glycosyl hydrolase [Nocardioidaceae bacterium]
MAELRATYRLQLGPGLDLDHARSLVPYLRALGVSHLYLSPCFEARPGSTHGYDVVDPTRVSEALGGERALRALAGAELGLILDVVPNHMAASEENRFWADPAARERFFDLDHETGRHRRFFDHDHLAGVRQEDPDVFAATHGLVLRLVRERAVDGLRVDHPDGLADPAGYLRRLRAAGAPRIWVEKVLQPGERLRDWPVEGTVGYEFLNEVTALFVDPAGETELTALYGELTGESRTFGELGLEARLEQVRTTFAPEVERLRRLRDHPGLERALASLPVYRTYVEAPGGRVELADREAVAASGMEPGLARALLLEEPAPAELVTRFQQTTPAVMAKGVEDTAFYRYGRLLALNEVGGDPSRFSLPVAALHAANAERARRFPLGLLATGTHDTKRSGDLRARIGALAGLAPAWREQVLRWERLSAGLVERGAPDPGERYLVYQTLVGAWPLEFERLEAYVEKALREAKRNTAWVGGDPDWERRARGFCRGLYAHAELRAEIGAFAARLARAGERAALGQLLLKLTSPGVPDIYQGDELGRLSLVDPDNRRPVDWARRREALAEVERGAPPERETVKLLLIRRALELRARRPGAFAGGYRALAAGEGCCAFLRGGELLAATLVRGPLGDAAVELPAEASGRWRSALSGEEVDLSGRLALERLGLDGWPVALLERVG